jgi:hypothetical protein
VATSATDLGEHRKRVVQLYLASALTQTRTVEQLALVPAIVQQLLTLDEERAQLVEEILQNRAALGPWPRIQTRSIALLQWELILGVVREAFSELEADGSGSGPFAAR